MFILVPSVCKVLQCLTSTLTQGVKVDTYSGSLVQSCCGGGWGDTADKYHWRVWGALQCLGHPGSAPACVLSQSALLRVQVLLQGHCLKWALVVALPRSKPLRFRFSGVPQRHRLGWVCVLCPSQVRAAGVWRAYSPQGGAVHLITSPVPAPRFPGCAAGVLPQMCCVCLLRKLIPSCDPPSGCQLSRIPGRLC